MQCVICGLGGQGVLFLSRVLARAGRLGGQGVLVGETHGMSQRGGSVFAFVKLGAYASSLVREGSADVVLCLAPSQVAGGVAYLRRGGVLCVNTANAEDLPEAVRAFATARGAAAHAIDATSIALAQKAGKGFNVALLGFASTVAPALPSAEILEQTLADISPPGLFAGNRALFSAGRAAGRAAAAGAVAATTGDTDG